MTNAEKFQEIFKKFATEVWAFPEKDFLTWLNAEYKEPTTKNDLGVDCISRNTVLTLINDVKNANGFSEYSQYEYLFDQVNTMPSVTPQPRWIPVSERLPEEHICDDGFHEPSKSVLVQMKSGAMHTARYWSRYDERWLDLNYPTTDEVIAWMPLTQPYKEVEE